MVGPAYLSEHGHKKEHGGAQVQPLRRVDLREHAATVRHRNAVVSRHYKMNSKHDEGDRTQKADSAMPCTKEQYLLNP
jgi:hypothetical protein